MGGQYKGYMYVRTYLHTYISQFELFLHPTHSFGESPRIHYTKLHYSQCSSLKSSLLLVNIALSNAHDPCIH